MLTERQRLIRNLFHAGIATQAIALATVSAGAASGDMRYLWLAKELQRVSNQWLINAILVSQTPEPPDGSMS